MSVTRPGRVSGKKALITGAAGGLGEAMAFMLAREGATVAVSDIDGGRAAALADRINTEIPGAAFAYAHDVASEDDWTRVIEAVAADLGGLSVLVNNAGIGGPLALVEQDTVENWQRQYEINLRSIMLGAKHAMPHLRAAAPASIINISSIAGLAAAPGMGAYNATKAGVWMYTKTLALEAAKADWNVRCNSVHPVFIKTPILDPFIAMAGGDEAKAAERLARGIPLKRIGEPDDVAYCVLYLASDESKFVTGSEFKIDGGMTAQ
ncbi:NAD(P)-dependent dehydrogenase (short-subunit alcohol dehydrogenase family) [Brevundimonas nasdae]|uniref:SDR family oxidoreductase n=1 Tax=Brevundimonas nasdae TaxID=172043 RepID=UPI00191210A2|nr:SDR family oxidoreductase [Brevundimonas nasdae]MBK6025440.1 glucose 1-dehydrogenase [Brevundimonas nasdae]MDQ0452070.1 NAD(P)-dependent dehydrogenase (short-subunit alcohol dehydrogenase family) [Brevundimonas nasdae]